MWRLGTALLVAAGVVGAIPFVVAIVEGREPTALALIYFSGLSILSWAAAMAVCIVAVYLPLALTAALVSSWADRIMRWAGVAALAASVPVAIGIMMRHGFEHDSAPLWARVLFVGVVGVVAVLTVRDGSRYSRALIARFDATD